MIKDLDDYNAIVDYKNGDTKSLNFLIKKYRNFLYSIINRYSKNNGNLFLDDHFQDIWLMILTKIDKCPEDNFGGWLSIVAKNLCIDRFRKRQRKITYEYNERYFEDDFIDFGYDNYKDIVLTEIYNNMDKILNERQVKVVTSRLKGIPFRTISQLFKIPYGTCTPMYINSIVKFRKHLVQKNLLNPKGLNLSLTRSNGESFKLFSKRSTVKIPKKGRPCLDGR